jgi:hypothetical protein
MGLTLLPETAFPFVYLHIHKEQEKKEASLEKKKRI